MNNPIFTVMDVETTGFFSGGTDRIVEIALIAIDAEGNILREYETLLNPERDLGPIHIHQITGAMVKEAPLFTDIMGDIAEFLAGSILVAHNVSFDYRFLEGEFQRAGVDMPDIPSVCTVKLVKEVNPDIPSAKLGNVCEFYDISLENSHSAYDDCKATARLLSILIDEYGLHNILQPLTSPPGVECWPQLSKSGICFKRCDYEELPRDNHIAELVVSLPGSGETTLEGEVEYLKQLESALADRKITVEEAQGLKELALEYNISSQKAVELHESYLIDLIRIALLDEVISDFEMADLKKVADLLDISEEKLFELISESEESRIPPEKRNDLRGKTVCFTGTLRSKHQDMPITRSVAQKLALEHGMIVKGNVTKGLDFLVTADPDSMSTKARKARKYDIDILAEQAFWSMLRVQVS